MAHLMCSILMEMINRKGLVSLFTGVFMDLVESWSEFLFQPQIMILLLLQIKAITNLSRAPNTLRMDLGTENVYCEELQVFFSKNSNIFLYAVSTRNQRIGAFWSPIKKFNLSWWTDFFSDLSKCRNL